MYQLATRNYSYHSTLYYYYSIPNEKSRACQLLGYLVLVCQMQSSHQDPHWTRSHQHSFRTFSLRISCSHLSVVFKTEHSFKYFVEVYQPYSFLWFCSFVFCGSCSVGKRWRCFRCGSGSFERVLSCFLQWFDSLNFECYCCWL